MAKKKTGEPNPKPQARLKLSPTEYKSLCGEVMRRDGYRCRNPLCRKREGLHAHHIIFRSQGGDDARENMATVCNECHNKLHGVGNGGTYTLVIKGVTGSTTPNPNPNADIGLRFVSKDEDRYIITRPEKGDTCPLPVK